MKKVLFLAGLVCAGSLFAADGASLYKSCVVCHGAKAEKPALNKSQIIADWSSDKIVAALQGYKDGSYGGPLKGTMKGQVAKLELEDMNTLGKYIAGLK